MKSKPLFFLSLAAMLLPITALNAQASDTPVYEIRIKNHRFSPERLEVPVGKKIKLTIINEDPTPEEFESYELNREKVISGNGKGIVFIGPLKEGEYPFFGEFNEDTAKGLIIASAQASEPQSSPAQEK